MTVGPTAGTGFELERFEWTAPGRLEVEGRWYGVRGRRFVRPTLEIAGARPLLALLEHKPWAPIDGQPWIAAFAWDGDPVEVEEAELAVAPDIAVVLGKVGDGAQPAPRGRRFHRESDASGRPRLAAVPAPPDLRPDLDAAVKARDAAYEARDAAIEERESLRHERDAAVRDLDAAREERDVATRERDELRAELETARAELRRRGGDEDEVRAELDAAVRERDELRAEREAAARGRDAALRERDHLRGERNAALRELDQLRADRGATAGLERAPADRPPAGVESAPADRGAPDASEPAPGGDSALARLRADRDEARAALRRVAAERDSALRARAERDAVVREHDAATVRASDPPSASTPHEDAIFRGLVIAAGALAFVLFVVLAAAVL